MLVFDPQSFRIDVTREFALCYAANLGAPMCGVASNGITLSDADFEHVVDLLDRTGARLSMTCLRPERPRHRVSPSQSRAIRKSLYSLASGLPASGRQS